MTWYLCVDSSPKKKLYKPYLKIKKNPQKFIFLSWAELGQGAPEAIFGKEESAVFQYVLNSCLLHMA